MYKVGFYYPSQSAHAVRGIGFYARLLLAGLSQTNDPDIQVIHIEDLSPSNTHDLSLIHLPYFDLFQASFPKLPIPSVVTIHDVIPLVYHHIYQPGIKGKINFLRQKQSLHRVPAIITDSYDSVQDIHQLLGVPHSKIKLIYLGADPVYRPATSTAAVQAAQKRYHVPDKYILYVGDINYNKNLSVLLNACINTSTHLVLVGKNAALIETLDTSHSELAHLSELKSLVTSPFVHRPGFVPDDDLRLLYCGALAYCQPSLKEGFGIPVLEALSCGTPVIVSSNAASLREIVSEAGLFFDSHSVSDLCEKIEQMKSDSRLRSTLSKQGLLRSKKFSWAKAAAQTIKVYRQVLYEA